MDVDKNYSHRIPDAEYIFHPSAKAYFEEAYDEHMNGFIDNAINLYQKSIDAQPSAPAYTFLAWAFSNLGEFETAITLCHKAIQTDPEYGNAYNDLGVYHLQTGDESEAIYWLEKALVAPKYHCKFFPFYNLGKIYKSRNMIQKALSCFEYATKLEPDFELAQQEYEELSCSLN